MLPCGEANAEERKDVPLPRGRGGGEVHPQRRGKSPEAGGGLRKKGKKNSRQKEGNRPPAASEVDHRFHDQERILVEQAMAKPPFRDQERRPLPDP